MSLNSVPSLTPVRFVHARRWRVAKRVVDFVGSASWLMLVMVFSFAALTQGQEFRAGISGNVTDASGASVVGALVQVTDVERKVKSTTSTNEVGRYAIEF